VSAAAHKHPRTQIYGIQSDQVMQVWKKARRLVKRVVRPETGETPDSVLTDIQMRRKQLWIVNDFQGAVITTVLDRPAQRVLFVPYLVGDHMTSWLDDWVRVMEEYARSLGCAAIEFNGRRGWNKIGERFPEYKSTQTIFRRDL
jgi:AraC-like DNA-binding protein